MAARPVVYKIKEIKNMTKFEEFENIVEKLRSPEGCPWDREQTHSSLKKPCIEEAAEVICGINILEETGNPDNLKEELGDLLLQVVMHARIAEEEGYFTMDDVIQGIIDKMVRRHPHVFGDAVVSESGKALTRWGLSVRKHLTLKAVSIPQVYNSPVFKRKPL